MEQPVFVCIIPIIALNMGSVKNKNCTKISSLAVPIKARKENNGNQINSGTLLVWSIMNTCKQR